MPFGNMMGPTPCCPGTGSPTRLCFAVSDCAVGPITSDATLVVSDGGGFSATISDPNDAGHYCADVPSAGTYSVAGTYHEPSGAVLTKTASYATGAGLYAFDFTTTDMVCVPCSGGGYFNSLPATVTLSDGQGSVTLARSGSTYLYNPACKSWSGDGIDGHDLYCSTLVPITGAVVYQLACNPTIPGPRDPEMGYNTSTWGLTAIWSASLSYDPATATYHVVGVGPAHCDSSSGTATVVLDGGPYCFPGLEHRAGTLTGTIIPLMLTGTIEVGGSTATITVTA